MKRTGDYEVRAVDILGRIQYATLATVNKDGTPWNSPVFALHDNQVCMYWFSDKAGRHSRNIQRSGYVCIVVYDSTVPEGQGEGVYIQAKAYVLEDPEEIRRVRALKKGFGNDDPASFMGKGIRRVYKAVPQAAWMNEAQIEQGVFIRDYRVKLSLASLRRRLRNR